MSSIAIDIVLLPSLEIQKRIIQMSQSLRWDRENFEQSLTDRVPHITMIMWCIEESELESIQRILSSLSVLQNRGIDIEYNWVKESALPDSRTWQYIDIVPSAELQKIYNHIVGKIKPLMSFHPNKSNFYDPEEVNTLTLEWVKNHDHKKEEAIFHPHISLGIWELDFQEQMGSINIDRIAIYQLGNYCTCRKELFSIYI